MFNPSCTEPFPAKIPIIAHFKNMIFVWVGTPYFREGKLVAIGAASEMTGEYLIKQKILPDHINV